MKYFGMLFDSKRAVEIISIRLLEFGFTEGDRRKIQSHLLSRTQFMVPIVSDLGLFRDFVNREIESLLRFMGDEFNFSDYKTWVEAMQWLFVTPIYGRLSLFIRKHHVVMGIALAITVPIFGKFI